MASLTIHGVSYRSFAQDVWEKVTADDVVGLGAELAYRFFLALIPLLMFAGAVGTLIAGWMGLEQPGQLIVDHLKARAPQDIADMIGKQIGQVMQSPRPGVMAGALFATMLTGAGAMNALIKSLNRLYKIVESRPFWRRYLVAILLAAGGSVALFVALSIFVIGQFYAGDAAKFLGLPEWFGYVLRILRFPVVFVILTGTVGFFYWAAPAEAVPFKWTSVGAAMFGIVWIIATYLFGLYVANFGQYSNTYGFLAGVAILLLWLYITNMVLLAGAEANSIMDERIDVSGDGQTLRDERLRST